MLATHAEAATKCGNAADPWTGVAGSCIPLNVRECGSSCVRKQQLAWSQMGWSKMRVWWGISQHEAGVSI